MDQITFFRQFMVVLHAHIRVHILPRVISAPTNIITKRLASLPYPNIRINPNHFQQINKHADKPGVLNIPQPNAPLLITMTVGVAGAVPAPSGKEIHHYHYCFI